MWKDMLKLNLIGHDNIREYQEYKVQAHSKREVYKSIF